MIVVNIFNGMETELTSNEGPVSENLKYFRHYCYSKMCNLIGMQGITKEYVTSLTMPYFECTYVEIKGQGFAELHFERYVPKPEPVKVEEKKVETPETPEDEDKGSEDKEALLDSINAAIETLPEVEETTEIKEETPAPVKRGRGRPKKNT